MKTRFLAIRALAGCTCAIAVIYASHAATLAKEENKAHGEVSISTNQIPPAMKDYWIKFINYTTDDIEVTINDEYECVTPSNQNSINVYADSSATLAIKINTDSSCNSDHLMTFKWGTNSQYQLRFKYDGTSYQYTGTPSSTTPSTDVTCSNAKEPEATVEGENCYSPNSAPSSDSGGAYIEFGRNTLK